MSGVPRTAAERLAAAIGGAVSQGNLISLNHLLPAKDGTRPVAADGYGDGPAEAILAADPTLAEDLELGMAWREVIEALPEGWYFSQIENEAENAWAAHATRPPWTADEALNGIPDDDYAQGHGPTPTEALLNLAQALATRLRA